MPVFFLEALGSSNVSPTPFFTDSNKPLKKGLPPPNFLFDTFLGETARFFTGAFFLGETDRFSTGAFFLGGALFFNSLTLSNHKIYFILANSSVFCKTQLFLFLNFLPLPKNCLI